jgi:V8-like Glu-specific endopeptidase
MLPAGDGQCPGCGFFIAPRLVITCAHVVGRDVPIGTEIPLRQWNDTTITP